MEFTRCFQCMEEITGYPCPNCGYDPAKCPSQSFVLRPGTILRGKYVIGAVLGQGGFGITYIGWDLALERKVAVKEYYPMGQVSRNAANSNTLEWNTSEQARLAQGGGMDYFLKEGRKMARVADIPQVVNVLDIFQENETAYIIMNYSQGQTLKTYLKRNGPLGWAEAETIFLPVVNAMEQVHKAGLIHRDLSPDNLMLLPDGSVKILDLGAAKDLNINTGASSMQVAKHGFSPLEQYLQRGGSGPWSDVYALAATMYYSLAGVLPLPSVDRLAEDTLRWDLPQLTALPENVLTALQRAMAISPKARTQSMAEFASQLTAPVTVQPQQPERKVEPDRDKGTEAKAVENKKPEAAPESKKEPAPKGKEVPEDTAASKEPEHSGGSSGKARKRLPVIAAVLTLLVVASGILIWNMKNAPAGSVESEKKPAQIQESSFPVENNTPTTEETVQPVKTWIWSGYDMPLEEFDQRFTQMIETANSWTRETAPQTLDDFPLFPPSFLELLKTVESAEEEMTSSDSILTWKSELSKFLPVVDTDMEYDRYFAYVDNNENAWVRIPFESIGTCEYSVQLPENVWEANNSDFELSIYGYNFSNEWDESLQVSYSISHKRIDGTNIVGLCMSNGQYSFNWFYYAQNSTIAVDIYSHSNGRVWWMTYDAASGKLVGLSK